MRRLRVVGVGLTLVTLSAAAQSVTRGPYLQMGTHDSIVIVWRTSFPANSRVVYGMSPDRMTETVYDAPLVTQHEVKVTGLTPETRYFYAVGTSSDLLAGGDSDHYFVTAPLAGTRKKLRLWVVGDSGTGDLNQIGVREAMRRYVGAERPDLFLHMGDMAYSDGTDLQFQLRFFAIYQEILRNTVSWPTMGNHEGVSSDSGSQRGPYYDAYVLPRQGEAGGLASGTEAYYAYDYANVHFVVLDSHDSPRSPDGAMLRWLQADLEATDQEWIIAYWHHPPYSKGTHDSDTEGQLVDMRENALPILEAAGVDLVLAGHSHIYERSYLIDGAYATPTTAAGHIVDSGDGKPEGDGPYRKRAGIQPREGAVYVVAGHGGASLGRQGTHPVMYFTEDEFGSCIVDVDGRRLSLVNVRKDGVVSDSFTLAKEAPNQPPVLSPIGPQRLALGSTLSFQVVATDPDGDPIVYLATGLPPGATLDSRTGAFSWTATQAGSYSVTFQANDGRGGIDEEQVLFTVEAQATLDGGVRLDGGGDAGLGDGGVANARTTSCGCAAGGGASAGIGWVLLLALATWRVRVRRWKARRAR